MNYVCRICRNSTDNTVYQCSEKLFGWGDQFAYFQCSRCSCLQIAKVPSDLGRYYPTSYYSFNLEPVSSHGLKSKIAGIRDLTAATGRGFLGRFLGKLVPAYRDDLVCLSSIPARKNMRILDVGCGRGQLLSVLHRAGFRNIQGVDLFIPASVEVLPGVVVRKANVEDLHDRFDLIMMHHVFEHVEDGGKTLAACLDRLTPGGKILLRIPTVDSESWEKYRENWAALDAPRHLFLYSLKSLEILARQAGLRVERHWCDSNVFQFWVSELYKKGIPYCGPNSAPEKHFTTAQMKEYAETAKKLNLCGRGDQIVAILTAQNAE